MAESDRWIWQRKIRARSGRMYTLSIGRDHLDLGCSCPDWTNRRDQRPHGCCKHLQSFLCGEFESQGVLPPEWLEHPLLQSWTPRSSDPDPITQPAVEQEVDLAAVSRPGERVDYTSQLLEDW